MNKIEVTRSNPALVLFMVDMSGSMSESINFENVNMPKCDALGRIVNQSLTEIILRCRRGNEYRNYFNIVVLGYDGSGVTSLLEKYNDTDSDFTTIDNLVNSDAPTVLYSSKCIVDGKTYITDRDVREFIKIRALERTPMFEALNKAHELGRKWVTSKGADSVPPIFINITDGGATDATEQDLIDISKKIKSLKSLGGNATFVNIHINDVSDSEAIIFPLGNKNLENIKYANTLYNMSSELSEVMSKQMSQIIGRKWLEGDKLRALAYNTPLTHLLDVIQIGSLSISE